MSAELAVHILPRASLVQRRVRFDPDERARIDRCRSERIEMYTARVEIIAMEIGVKRIGTDAFDLRATLAQRTIFATP